MIQKNTHTKTPKLRFPEFFDNWKDSTIEENCELKGRIGFRGYTKKDLVDKDDGVLVLGGKHIQGNVLNLSEPTYLSWDKYFESPEIMVKMHDIIFSQRGSLGDCALIDSDIGEATINPSMVLIKKISCDYRFLFYILVGNSIQKQVKSISTSTAVPMLSQKQIKNFSFKLPELSEQQKIASFLSEVDKKINLLQQKKSLLEDYKKGVIQQIFSREIRFKPKDGGEYPEWEEKKLGEICKLQGGFAFKSSLFKKAGIPIIRISNISNSNNYIDQENVVYYEAFEINTNYILTKGDLIVAMSGATTGKASIYDLEEIGYLNQRVGVFRPESNLLNTYLTQFVFSDKFRVQLDSVLVAGAQPNISSKDIENFEIPIPSIEEQTQIANFLSALDEKIQLVAEALEATQQFKKGLLQQMFV